MQTLIEEGFMSPNRAIKLLKKQRAEIRDRMLLAVMEVEKPFWDELNVIDEAIRSIQNERRLAKSMQ